MRAIIIGMGFMGRKHLRAYKKLGIDVAGIVDTGEMSEESSIPVFTDIKEAIDTLMPTHASICTPTETHLDIARICRKKDVRVLVEKPISHDDIKSDEILSMGAMCAYTELYNPYIMEMLSHLSEPKAVLIEISGDKSQKIEDEGRMVMYNRLIHVTYILEKIFPGMPEIRTHLHNEDILGAKLDYGGRNAVIIIKKGSSLSKTISISGRTNLHYSLKSGIERLIVDGKEISVRSADMLENMISEFVGGRTDEVTYAAKIARKIVENKTLENTKKRADRVVKTIRPSLACNQNCFFCNVRDEHGFSDKRCYDILMGIISDPCDEVIITGGEPTILPFFMKMLMVLKSLGVNICVQTNALMFHYPKFAKEASLYVSEALVSLHSHDPLLSDKITALDGSWVRTMDGIKNLIKNKVRVRIAHVLCSVNYMHLPEFIQSIDQGISGVDIMLDQNRDSRHDIPSLKSIAPYVKEAIRIAWQRRLELINAFTIPLCHWPLPQTSHEYILLSTGADYKGENKVKPDFCRDCIYDPYCKGVWEGYAKTYGFDELSPIMIEDEIRKDK